VVLDRVDLALQDDVDIFGLFRIFIDHLVIATEGEHFAAPVHVQTGFAIQHGKEAVAVRQHVVKCRQLSGSKELGPGQGLFQEFDLLFIEVKPNLGLLIRGNSL